MNHISDCTSVYLEGGRREMSALPFSPNTPMKKRRIIKVRFEIHGHGKMRPTDQPSNHARFFKTDILI